ncbi:MAG: hypothetical protein JF586_15215 [Burkholderiales bacterium]|jgi:hypothetical protein|nr:hypothetical protein [Burkholderiales bacterium]
MWWKARLPEIFAGLVMLGGATWLWNLKPSVANIFEAIQMPTPPGAERLDFDRLHEGEGDGADFEYIALIEADDLAPICALPDSQPLTDPVPEPLGVYAARLPAPRCIRYWNNGGEWATMVVAPRWLAIYFRHT